MSGLQYYVIDLESNGLVSGYHEVTEVSIIRCSDCVQLTEFIKCDYPERSNADALRITKKTLSDLEKGSSKELAAQKIDKFLNEDGLTPSHRCFIGHNVQFDRKMIFALYSSINKTFNGSLWLCTMALTKKYIKQMGLGKQKANLQAACELLNVKKTSAAAHASKADSRNTYFLWKNLEEKGIDHLPLIKTAQHILSSSNEEQGLDPDLLDINE